MNSWFENDKAKADFRVVYIAEAHATDGRQVQANVRDGILIPTHKQFEERLKAAELLRDELGIKIPIIVDVMDDAINRAYAAWPDRIYVVDKSGKLAYVGGPGPGGFKPDEAKAALSKLIQ